MEKEFIVQNSLVGQGNIDSMFERNADGDLNEQINVEGYSYDNPLVTMLDSFNFIGVVVVILVVVTLAFGLAKASVNASTKAFDPEAKATQKAAFKATFIKALVLFGVLAGLIGVIVQAVLVFL